MAHPAIHLRSVVCLLDRFPALTGIDLDVAEGEALLVTGSNGAGKTTLLRLLAGLLPAASGDAQVFGCDLVRDRRAVRRRVGLLSEGTGCYDDLTVRENLLFRARSGGLSTRAAEVAIEQWGLTRLADAVHAKMSTGERRRLAFAAMMIREPDMLLLDEPHAGLDAKGRALLAELVRDSTARGCTVLIASHEIAEARGLVSREVTLAGGRMLAASEVGVAFAAASGAAASGAAASEARAPSAGAPRS